MKTTTKLLSLLAGTCLSTMASAATTIWTPTDGNVNILDFGTLVGGNPGITYDLFDNSATDFTTGGLSLAIFDVVTFEKVADDGWVAANNAGDSIILGDTNQFQLTASRNADPATEVLTANPVAESGAALVTFYSDTAFADLLVVDATPTTSAVPVPAAVWLFGSGLVGLIGLSRRRNMV